MTVIVFVYLALTERIFSGMLFLLVIAIYLQCQREEKSKLSFILLGESRYQKKHLAL